MTGQAAGTAAAVAVSAGVEPRSVKIISVQAALAKQGVFLRPADVDAVAEQQAA